MSKDASKGEVMERVDTVIVGAGIAGLSLAARLARHGTVLVLDAESAPGYHASGRSVAYAHFGLGERIVRTLTALSLTELGAAGDGDQAAVARVHPALHVARADQVETLDALEQVHRDFHCDYSRLSTDEVSTLVPALKTGPDHIRAALIDHGALKLDTDAMLQRHVRTLRDAGSKLACDARVEAIARSASCWRVETTKGNFEAAVLVNAAGAWADELARMAGVSPIGIEPRRRTVIAFEAPGGSGVADWPFVKTVGEGFYMLPEGSSQLLASPMDEGPSGPCDAGPEEIDIATIAHRIEEATNLDVRRIAHSWAGLRSFAPDELPVVGYAANAPGFFWCVGQGGYGFQTAPALSRVAEVLATGATWPDEFAEQGLAPGLFSPDRFAKAEA
jgi:D-arginine dehydrogenase